MAGSEATSTFAIVFAAGSVRNDIAKPWDNSRPDAGLQVRDFNPVASESENRFEAAGVGMDVLPFSKRQATIGCKSVPSGL